MYLLYTPRISPLENDPKAARNNASRKVGEPRFEIGPCVPRLPPVCFTDGSSPAKAMIWSMRWNLSSGMSSARIVAARNGVMPGMESRYFTSLPTLHSCTISFFNFSQRFTRSAEMEARDMWRYSLRYRPWIMRLVAVLRSFQKCRTRAFFFAISCVSMKRYPYCCDARNARCDASTLSVLRFLMESRAICLVCRGFATLTKKPESASVRAACQWYGPVLSKWGHLR